MSKDAHPSFEVATVKPHDPTSDAQGFTVEGSRVVVRNESLIQLLLVAYSIHRSQIDGLPTWARDRWDIQGTTDTPGEPSLPQQQEMLQKLLADRFALKFHIEQRELPVYLMQLAKGAPKLKPAAKPDEQPGQSASGQDGVITIVYTSTAMSDFVMLESFFLDRPLVDQTSLAGKYDFSLRYTYKESNPPDSAGAAPGLFTAVQEQLGLKFIPTKSAVRVLVIDHVDRPSAN
jgi:uncharacterized protein (TIGR03435 family)